MDTLDDIDLIEDPPPNAPRALRELGALYSLELGNVQAYGRALCSSVVGAYGDTLTTLQRAHEERAVQLGDQITELGGTRPDSLRITDSLHVLFADAAASLSSTSALAALERCEDHGVAAYEKAMRKLLGDPHRVVAELYPRQQDAHQVIRTLKQAS